MFYTQNQKTKDRCTSSIFNYDWFPSRLLIACFIIANASTSETNFCFIVCTDFYMPYNFLPCPLNCIYICVCVWENSIS